MNTIIRTSLVLEHVTIHHKFNIRNYYFLFSWKLNIIYCASHTTKYFGTKMLSKAQSHEMFKFIDFKVASL
jgi:hypothetical protein